MHHVLAFNEGAAFSARLESVHSKFLQATQDIQQRQKRHDEESEVIDTKI